MGRLYLAVFLALGMVASLLWFNGQVSRRNAVEAVAEALGPDQPTFRVDGKRDYHRPGTLLKYNNLWCGTVTTGPARRFAVLVRQPGGRRHNEQSVIDLAFRPAGIEHTARQAMMVDACASVWR